jgi:ribonuclease P protein subunit POP4
MNALTDEIIGLTAKIKSSKNKGAEGLTGTIIDETKNMIILRTKNGDKKLIKKQHIFEIHENEVSGAELVGRPEERIKRWIRK